MLKILFIVFFLQFSLLGYSQTIAVCQSDSLVDFSVVPSSLSNLLQWEFIQGEDAQIIQGQNTESISVSFSSPGNYVLEFTESFASGGCSGGVTLDIVVNSKPRVSFNYVAACMGQEMMFMNTSISDNEIVSYNWSLLDLNQSTENFPYTFNQSGEFAVTLSMMDEFGCSSSTTKMVNVSELPKANFYFDSKDDITILEPTVDFYNLSSEGQMLWNFGDDEFSTEINPTHFYNDAGWHEITLSIENESGCVDTISKELLVQSTLVLFLPSAFTPDGDNINDTFGPSGFSMDRLSSFQFQVLNKWGQVIFETFDRDLRWNGVLNNGQDAMIDTYTWNLNVQDELGKIHHLQGLVDLLK